MIHPQPEISEKFTPVIPVPEKIRLSNGLDIYLLNGGEQDVIKMELVYPAGNLVESIPLLAGTTCELLGEGTHSHTASEITHHFDYFGSYIQRETTRDHSIVALFSLSKYLPEILPWFLEILTESSFPEEELLLNLFNRKARFESNLQKVDFVARNEFSQQLFGNHPYGQPNRLEDFDALQTNDLRTFYTKYFQQALPTVFLAGKFSDTDLKQIYATLEKLTGSVLNTADVEGPAENIAPTSRHIEMPDVVQTAIRMGKRTPRLNHPDYPAISLMNTIFGGYYGSRLMQNIRQEKGYTYGIHSGLTSLQKAGTLTLATEVGKEYTEATLTEIYKEMTRLTDEPVGETELRMAKNYVQGNFLKSTDGVFALAERIRALVLNELPWNYYQTFLLDIQHTTPEKLQETAVNYLTPDSFSKLTAGAEN